MKTGQLSTGARCLYRVLTKGDVDPTLPLAATQCILFIAGVLTGSVDPSNAADSRLAPAFCVSVTVQYADGDSSDI